MIYDRLCVVDEFSGPRATAAGTYWVTWGQTLCGVGGRDIVVTRKPKSPEEAAWLRDNVFPRLHNPKTGRIIGCEESDMLPSPQLRAAMNIATKFLLPEATVFEETDSFTVENPAVEPPVPTIGRVPYRSLYAALDKGYSQFVEQLKLHYKTLGWL